MGVSGARVLQDSPQPSGTKQASLRMLVMEHMYSGRVELRRILYGLFITFMAHRSTTAAVDIIMLHPTAEKPDPRKSLNDDYYAYAKRLLGSSDGRLPSPDGDASDVDIRTVEKHTTGCLIADAAVVLSLYFGMGIKCTSVLASSTNKLDIQMLCVCL